MSPGAPTRLEGAALESLGQQAVVTPHYLASQAALETMARGGNAVDAAIAANATLGVVAPDTCGIGGDLFALVHQPGTTVPDALNASGRAGARADSAAVRDAGHTSIPIRSPWSATVPGCVDGWEALAERHARLPLRKSLAPAIEHAIEGFPATPELSASLTRLQPVLAGQDSGAALYPNGDAPQPGELLTRPDLARTLADIGSDGRQAFYTGAIGEKLVTATNGLVQPEDLSRVQADWIQAISLDIMGWTGWTIPPNSQGYLTLAAAWLFEQLDPPHDPNDPLFTHAAIEAYRAVAWERDDFVADAACSPMPPERLLDLSRLRDRLERITMHRRTTWPTPSPTLGGTAYLCVRDATGMGVSLIQSNFHGIGSGIGVGDAGFFLQDRGSSFSLIPGHPNELAPGKRPLHTLSPSLWTRNDALAMLLGTRGGHFQPQTLLQMVTYMLWGEQDAAAAQQLARWTSGEWRDEGTTLSYEPHLAGTVVADLEQLGHEPTPAPGWMAGWGPVSVITGEGNQVVGSADPRVSATAALAE
ncbi:MAG: gamma-glutamyltransferase [Actinomycetota bacterium]|nr:gamma-glutamyltransferase [Actinomycetota bacterium]